MNDWPHEKIHSAAIRYIRQHVSTEAGWRYTRIDALPDPLARIARLEPGERPIVSCCVDGLRWHVMTTSRVFGNVRGSTFNCSPLEVTQWRWGNFNANGRSGVETATLSLADGTHLRFPYETGPAGMAQLCYERFWTTEYPTLKSTCQAGKSGEI